MYLLHAPLDAVRTIKGWLCLGNMLYFQTRRRNSTLVQRIPYLNPGFHYPSSSFNDPKLVLDLIH